MKKDVINNRETKVTKKSLFFPVRKMKTVDTFLNADMEMNSSRIATAIVATKEDGKDKLVNFVSNSYSLVPIKDILTPFEKVLKAEGVKYKATYRHWDYSRFYVDYVIEGKGAKIGKKKNDELQQRISIRHSYDGWMKFSITHGVYREICSNGMMGWATESEFSGKHTASLTAEKIEAMTLSMVENLDETFKNVIEPFIVLADRAVPKWADRLEEVLNAVSGTPKKMVDDIQQTIMKEAKELKVPVSDWLIFNGINFQLNHNKDLNNRAEDREKVDANVLNWMMKNEPTTKKTKVVA